VLTLHQNLGLDDRHDAGLLAEARIACERMGVRLDAAMGRSPLADPDHRSPLGEASAQLAVLAQAAAQPVESLRDGLPAEARERLGAQIHLDARQDARARQELGEGRAVVARLPKGLVVHDHAADAVGRALRCEHQPPEAAPRLRRRLDPDGLEPLRHRGIALIGGEDALCRCDHRPSRFLERWTVHRHRSSRRCGVDRASMRHTPRSAPVAAKNARPSTRSGERPAHRIGRDRLRCMLVTSPTRGWQAIAASRVAASAAASKPVRSSGLVAAAARSRTGTARLVSTLTSLPRLGRWGRPPYAGRH
jgi:hypothetical protein